MIDPGMSYILLPIIRILVLQIARVEPKERIMRKEHGTAISAAERQCNVIIFLSVSHSSIACPSLLIYVLGNRMGWGRCCEDIADQGLVPS